MASIGMAWRTGRAQRAVQRARMPLTYRAVTWLARKVPTLRRARSAIMQTGACAAGTVAAFEAATWAGWLAVCASLFLLEALGGER